MGRIRVLVDISTTAELAFRYISLHLRLDQPDPARGSPEHVSNLHLATRLGRPDPAKGQKGSSGTRQIRISWALDRPDPARRTRRRAESVSGQVSRNMLKLGQISSKCYKTWSNLSDKCNSLVKSLASAQNWSKSLANAKAGSCLLHMQKLDQVSCKF